MPGTQRYHQDRASESLVSANSEASLQGMRVKVEYGLNQVEVGTSTIYQLQYIYRRGLGRLYESGQESPRLSSVWGQWEKHRGKVGGTLGVMGAGMSQSPEG